MLWGNILFCTAQIAENFVLNNCLTDSIEYNSIPIINTRNLSNHILYKNISVSSTNTLYLKTPSIGNQGHQGSCTAWAFGYAGMSILAYDKFEDWNKANRSPSYLFYKSKSDVSQDCTIGVTMIQAANAAVTHGCCSMALMPYNQDSCTITPNNSQNFDAILNRLSYGRLASTMDVDLYKQSLYAGYPIVVNFAVYKSFDDMWNTNGIWQNNDPIALRGYHAACVVGYDDTKQMLKVQNSWGNGGDSGYFWVTYSLIENGCFNEAYVLFNITDDDYPEIQGPSQFCDTASYTLTNVPAGATITWKNYNRMNLTYPYYIKSGQGTSRVLYQRGKQDDGRLHRPNFVSPDYTGSAVVSATVSLNGHSYTVSKNVYIGTIAPQVLLYNAQGTMQVAPRVGASYRLLVNNCTDVADNQFHWVVSSSVQEFERLGQGRYFPLTIDEQQTVTAQVSYSTDECGTVTTTKTFSFTLPVTSSSASLVFRNPAGVGEDLEVGIVLPDENPSSTTYGLRPNTEIGAYTLELWSELYGRVRTVEADTPTTQMSLSGLNAGTYFLKLIINNEIVATQQLIIK